MSDDQAKPARPMTAMSALQLRVAMRNTVEAIEDDKRRGITTEQIGPGKINEAFRKATQP